MQDFVHQPYDKEVASQFVVSILAQAILASSFPEEFS